MAKDVIVYSQPGWAACDNEKEFLSQKGIAFTRKDVSQDPAALKELISLGFRATPVTIVAGETVVGFDRGRLERLLGLA